MRSIHAGLMEIKTMHGTTAVKTILCLALMTMMLGPSQAQAAGGLNRIQTIVVIYAENRSFDNLYGGFPGANGLAQATPGASAQLDRDGSVLKELPPVWD